MDPRVFAFAAAAISLGAAAPAPPSPYARLPAYLTMENAPEVVRLLPPAPTASSMRGQTDRSVFRATRALKDTPRWDLAKVDLDESTPAMLRDFSCAAGVRLTPANSPLLTDLLRHMRSDVFMAVSKAKANYLERRRPFLIDRGQICVERTEQLINSPDYPSGHATWGWSVGLVLAELDPAHATPILLRARAFGESRVVCGVHNASAVEAGRTNASIIVAALHGAPQFRADLEAARAELAANRGAGGNDPDACAAEARVIARSPW